MAVWTVEIYNIHAFTSIAASLMNCLAAMPQIAGTVMMYLISLSLIPTVPIFNASNKCVCKYRMDIVKIVLAGYDFPAKSSTVVDREII
jgi:hypothetical protein